MVAKIQCRRPPALILLTTLVLLAAPLAAEAQEAGRIYRVGYIGGSPQAAPLIEQLRGGLRDLGYVEGRNLILEVRWGEGNRDRSRTLVRELLALHMDVIVAGPQPSIRAATEATATIPIVMVLAGDPVGSGFVASLARPGRNVTGLTVDVGPDIEGKRLEILKDAIPTVSRVAVLQDPRSSQAVLEDAARRLNVTLERFDVQAVEDIESALTSLSRQGLDALYVRWNPPLYSHRHEIIELAARRRLPTIFGERQSVDSGGLMSYGASWSDLMRRSTSYVDKILKGAKPADLPVEQPTKFELVINLKTAKVLGLAIPQSLLLRADEVIQ